MATNKSSKSTSFVSLNRQYREVKRKIFNEASTEDLKNLLVVAAKPLKESSEGVEAIFRALIVSSLTEQLVKKEKSNGPNLKPATRSGGQYDLPFTD